jgi:antitoxin (DNA-binding transcriptional repressor) of toxin-antitoxin stability system
MVYLVYRLAIFSLPMNTTVNIHMAKTQLSRLIQAAEQGEEVVIARGGQPVAKLIALKSGKVTRKPGTAKGKIKIHDDFDAPLPEDIAGPLGL